MISPVMGRIRLFQPGGPAGPAPTTPAPGPARGGILGIVVLLLGAFFLLR